MSLSPANTLFLREVSEKKLRKLTELAYQNPNPLYNAIRCGYFNIIRKKALDFLEIEKQKAEFDEVKQSFENAISIMEGSL